MDSPTSNNYRSLANTEKLISDKDLEDKNNELNDFLSDHSASISPDFNIHKTNDDMINNIINQELNDIKNEDEKPDITNHTIDLTGGDDETFRPPEELDDYQRATPQEKMQMKFNLLRKLAELKVDYKVQFFKDYTLKDDYYDIKREYDYHTGERAKKQKVRQYTKITITGVKFLEKLSKNFRILNNSYINLSGWGDQVEMRREELICILEELYEKYSMGPSQASPETRFLMLIFTSALYAGFANFSTKNLSGNLFNNNKQNIEDIEIDITKQSIIDQNLKQNNQQPIKSDQELYNQIQDDATRASNMIKQQQIRKGNYDINEKYKNELINRGLEKTYNQPELEQPDLNDVPSIVALTVDNDDSQEKKKKPRFRTSKKNKD